MKDSRPFIDGSMVSDTNTNKSGAAVMSALIFGLLVGFGGGWYWRGHTNITPRGQDMLQDTSHSGSAVNQTDAGGSGGSGITDSVYISSQPAGDSVVVSSVNLKEPVWVAIREDDNGGLGKILGALRLDSGAYASVVVSLLRSTVAGGKYHVVLYQDDGTKTFDYKTAALIAGIDQLFMVAASPVGI